MSTLSSANADSGFASEITSQYVIFTLDGQRYALALDTVERIVRAVEVTPLPEAPAVVLGVINVEGRVLPVLNLRQRFLLPHRDINLDDQFMIAYTGSRDVVLVIDETVGVIERDPSQIIAPNLVAAGLKHINGIVQLDDGLVLIHDLEKFLTQDEERTLTEAIGRAR
ncbi:MAG TPA: chemotaxis protein CheW [Methylophilaceae bacterium]|nr:chemotaxis protein CheW [Methylophilaceae bacterium]